MKQQITKMLLVLMLGAMTFADVFAACPVTALSYDGSTSVNARTPSARWRKATGVYLLTPAEMAASGLPVSQIISQIGWNYSTAPGVVGTGTLVVYLQNTSDVTNLKSTTFATAIAGMTTVHNASTTLPNTTGFFNITFAGGSPFTYTGGGIYVAWDWCYLSGTLSTLAVSGCNTTSNAGVNTLSAQSTTAISCANLLAAGSAFRPATTFTPAGFANDAAAGLIYTTGSLPLSYTVGHIIQATVTNPGNNTLTSLLVTLNITGANSFTNTQTIATLAPCATTTVTFTPFTPSASGTNTITLSVPGDDNNANNTTVMTQEITVDYFSYRYPGTANSGGVGFNGGTGQFCGKFNTALPAFVQEVQVDFTTSGQPYRLAIYGDAGGVPGSLLYEDAANRSSAIGTAFLTLATNVSIPAGNFYVSIEQEGTTNVGFAYTTENPMRSGGFFFTSLPAGLWTDLGPGNFPFRFNIRVNLHLPVPPNCATSFSPANLSTGNCLNSVLTWVSGGGAPTGFRLTYGTNSPNYDNILNNVDMGNVLTYNPGILTPGTTYGYKVVPYNSDGLATGCTLNTFTTVASGALPFTEDFSGIQFPPTCWNRSDITFILRNNASTTGVGSAEFDFFFANAGNYDLTTPIFGNTPAGEVLSFNFAYATFSTEVDQLEIQYSTNQGGSFTSLEVLNGGPNGILNTGGMSAVEFVPTTAQWGLHQVVLPAGTNMIKFRGISAFGNDLYLDNISVASPPPLPTCPTGHSPSNALTNVFRDATLSWTNGGGATGYDVYFDLGAGPATTLVSANQSSTSYTPATMAANQQYSWRVVAKNITGDATGCADLTFTTGSVYDYCNPVHTPGCGNGNITNVTFNTLNNTTICNPPASQNFPISGSTTTSVNKGSSYNLSVTCDVACIISVWIDWDHDGTFSASEWTQVATASTANVADVISIAIPVTAQPGLTGMRIRSRFSGNINGDVDACTVMGSGEAEDYWITVNCAGSASTNAPICSNTTLNLFSGPTGATFSWTGPASFTSAVQNPTISNALVGTNDGTYNVNVTSTGCNENFPVGVVINALPTLAPTVSSPFCEGTSNLVLTANGSGASPFVYTWNGPAVSNQVSANGIATVTNAPASASGLYTINIVDNNTCTNSSSISALVYALPPVDVTIIGNANLCTGQTTSDLQASGALTYLWSTTETTSLITVSTQGTYSVTGTDVHNCVNSDQVIITESAAPAAPIVSPAGPVVLCTDGFTTTSVNLSVTNYATNLLWSTSETAQTISINYADIINVTYTDGNGCYSVSNPVTTTVDNYSTAPTGASTTAAFNNICLGNTVSLSVVGGSLGDNAQWVWYEGGCGSGAPIASGANPTITPLTAGSHTYFVRSESVSCGNTGCASVTITVSPNSPLNTIHYTASINNGCNGTSFTFSVNAVSGAAFYNWSGGAGVLINGVPGPVQTASNSVLVTFASPPPAGASGYNICCFAGNACVSSNTICTWVRAKVTQPGNIIGSNIACATNNLTYNIGSIIGADSYTWSITGAAGINGGGPTLTTPSTSITVNFLGGWTSGTLSVTANMNCGFVSAVRNLGISSTPAIPGTMSGPSYVCSAVGPNVYSVAPINGASSYNWTCSVPGAVLTPSANTCSISFPAVIPAGSIVSVAAISSCGNSSPIRSKGIASGLPGTPGNIIGATSGKCNELGASYSVSSTSTGATSYLWTITGGASIQFPNFLSAVSIDFPANFSSGVITVNGVNACGNGGARTLTVIGAPAMPGTISANPITWCTNSFVNFSISGSAGAISYTWSVSNGSILAGQGSNNIDVIWGATLPGTVSVTAINSCGNSSTRTQNFNSYNCKEGQVISSAYHTVSVFPNPAHDKTVVSYYSTSEGYVQMTITDLLGRDVMTQSLKAAAGDNQHETDLSSLAKGVYMVHLKGENLNEVVKVTVE